MSGPFAFHRPNMCRRHFRTAAAVYEFEPADRASLGVSSQDDPAKNAVAHDPRDCETRALSALFEHERRLFFAKVYRCTLLSNTRKQRLAFIETQREDAIEIDGRDRAYGGLGAARNLSLLVQDALLNHARLTAEGNGIREIQIASGLDQREIHSARRRIGDNSVNSCHGEITARPDDLARFIVNDPIADAGLHATEVLPGKLYRSAGLSS